MSAILPHREITPQRPDSLADEAVPREPVSPCYSLFSPVMFGKNRQFSFSWNDLRSIFFQLLSTFPSVMVFSPAARPAIISPQNRGYFFKVSGTLDLVTGGKFQTTAKATTALFTASFANFAFGHGPRARQPPPLFNQGDAPCPRTNMGSAGRSGPSAGRKLQQPRIS
jgi:hypothetical protein